MYLKNLNSIIVILVIISFIGCSTKKESRMKFKGEQNEVKLMTLDPGHFHAALVQKTQYKQVSPIVHIYAPEGEDVEDHLKESKDSTIEQKILQTGSLNSIQGMIF